MITVRIPTAMRGLTDGSPIAELPAGTVGEVLESLLDRFPEVRTRILDDQGKVRRFVNLYVGEEDIRFADGLETPVPDGGTLSILPAVAGG